MTRRHEASKATFSLRCTRRPVLLAAIQILILHLCAVNTTAAPSGCVYGEWSAYGACSAACNTGYRSRTRAVQNASHGATCSNTDYTTEAQACNTALCGMGLAFQLILCCADSRYQARPPPTGLPSCSGLCGYTQRECSLQQRYKQL